MLNNIIQIALFILSAAAIYFVTTKNKYTKWGHVIGLAAQPLWFYTTITNEQWGLLALTVFYTLNWIKGIKNYWFDGE